MNPYPCSSLLGVRRQLPRVALGKHRLGNLHLGQKPGVAVRGKAQNQNGLLNPGFPQLLGLLQVGYREPVRPRRLAFLRQRHRPVTVAVGLNHAHQLCAGGNGASDFSDIVVQGVQIHLGPGSL